jgi:hypothetical protein
LAERRIPLMHQALNNLLGLDLKQRLEEIVKDAESGPWTGLVKKDLSHPPIESTGFAGKTVGGWQVAATEFVIEGRRRYAAAATKDGTVINLELIAEEMYKIAEKQHGETKP